MAKKINITAGNVQMKAELNNAATADLLWEKLPVEGKVNTWGEEIYFAVPIESGLENAVSVVEEGDLAYWPEGKSFCIFFGQTPVSTADEIKPASPVNLLGRLLGNPKEWQAVGDGEEITLEKAE
ncbi:MAG: cyclophilin-like fold protein [Bacillota bacterium]